MLFKKNIYIFLKKYKKFVNFFYMRYLARWTRQFWDAWWYHALPMKEIVYFYFIFAYAHVLNLNYKNSLILKQ